MGNITPYDLYTGRCPEITRRRKVVESKTLAAGIAYNKTATEPGGRASKVSNISDGSITHFRGLHIVAAYNKYKVGKT
jgi:hypothetical protein